ncbi:transporter [Myxococcus stipitatus DSM 14675]|uniref:Transporter n=1 Tax=Myxococcus stipitatus (strain DSM 14675 / JCM 12634 / Mx s8) TaxID=1278073 RepID=L7UD96_MYXSD|nr:TrkA C-terminal domain-containing protein [Myxococcus stipitatus]AGC45572.1 transporter [Myxococcus stipitatus DSM 14675]
MRSQARHAIILAGAAVVGLAVIAFAQGQPPAAVQPEPHGVFGALLNYLHKQPFILLFLVVAAGFALGEVKVKGVGMGSTAATLLLALVVSFWAFHSYKIQYALPEFTSTVFFNLFIFAIGMKVGPQFLGGIHREGKHLILLALLVPLLSSALVYASRFVTTLAPGLLAGILSGANTATPGFGAAQAALASGAAKLSPEHAKLATDNLTTSYAFLYCISMVAFTVMMSFLPRMFGRDAVADGKAMEKELSGEDSAPLPGTADAFIRGYMPLDLRVFRVENPALEGRTVADLDHAHPRVAVERVYHDGKVYNPPPDLVLHRGDEVAMLGPVSLLLAGGPHIGPEVDDSKLRNVKFDTVEFIVQNKEVVGKTLGELAQHMGQGIYLNAIFRAGDQLPVSRDRTVNKGDVLRITGSARRVAGLKQVLGPAVKPSLSTDIITLGLGLAAGALLGAITIPLFGIQFSLGSAVGLLVVSIGLSILRTHNPAFGGPFPESARQLLEDLGLNVFIAILGLNAGPGVQHAIEQGLLGPTLIIGSIAAFVPPLVGWVVGQYVFKMNTAVLMGAIAGARCNSAGMRAAQEASKSIVPAIGYPVTFAISNLLLTLICYLFALMG